MPHFFERTRSTDRAIHLLLTLSAWKVRHTMIIDVDMHRGYGTYKIDLLVIGCSHPLSYTSFHSSFLCWSCASEKKKKLTAWHLNVAWCSLPSMNKDNATDGNSMLRVLQRTICGEEEIRRFQRKYEDYEYRWVSTVVQSGEF